MRPAEHSKEANMDKLRHKEYDFGSKLRQASVIERLKDYIAWFRNLKSAPSGNPLPPYSPVSINLDLTSSCNFACPHCVDSGIINTGKHLEFETIKQTIDTLQEKGLLSIILIGGGEPTLHKDFEKIVRYIKGKGLQLGIVTNGSRLLKVAQIADLLGNEDWLRLSLDAGSEKTFAQSHMPKISLSLQEILTNAQKIKKSNPGLTLGYSFVIVWNNLFLNGLALTPNINEMPEAARLASAHSFDYISFKPCLIRQEQSQKESLLEKSDREQEQRIRETIQNNLKTAQEAVQNNLKILTSVNLRALLSNQLSELKNQPARCHMQFFNSVITPSGIFRCPAFRGVDQAQIGSCEGYARQPNFENTSKTLAREIQNYDSHQECKVIACFYNHVNWWVENIITSTDAPDSLPVAQDDNFFL
jgi:MoaA/NifB/PqqE/SkfB family radical SAM enzyme